MAEEGECDELLASLEMCDGRDEATERLELAIMDDRLEAMLGARACAATAVG